MHPRWKSTLLTALVVLGLLVTIGLPVLASHPPALLRVGAAYAAKIVCSGLYLEGRDPDRVLHEDVQSPGSLLLRLMRVEVDREQGIVRAGLFGFIGDGVAVAQPGLGCRVVADGRLDRVAHFGRAAAPTPAPRPQPWPEGETAVPDPKLERLIADDALAGAGVRAILIAQHRRLLAERYGAGFDAGTRQLGWSMTKTVTAALAGLLVQEGRLHTDSPTGLYREGDPRAQIRICDLLSMTSGLASNENHGRVSDAARMLFLEPDMAAFAAQHALEHPPGTFWRYSNGSAVMVAHLFQQAAGSEALALVRTRLFEPLGMRSAVIETDEGGTLVGSSYMYATPRDWARFGEFLLEGGAWHGADLLPPGYVAQMRAPVAPSGGQYGAGMVWLRGSDTTAETTATGPGPNPDRGYGLPEDTFWMQGHDGQYVAMIPSRGVVIVRMGVTPGTLGFRPQPLVQAVLRALPP
ncbi:MAG TPA: serine hydrolase [Steroidobacteraceae bacterium]|nr:serine hydrolase [Steroidobacteraceae bacterium]